MFARVHLRYQTQYKFLYFLPSRTFVKFDCEPVNPPITTDKAINPFEEQEDVFFLASLDGLVCVALAEAQDLAFWNPVTGAYKTLMTPVHFFHDLLGCNTPLAFYMDSCKDYKLLYINSEGAFIYSWRLDSWRKIDNISSQIRRYISNLMWLLGTVSRGKVYFNLETKGNTLGERRIISFDVESEEFKEIPFPPLPRTPCWSVSSVTLNGCNHLCVTYGGGFKCDMWRMVENGWIKVAIFSSNQMKPHRMAHIRRNGNWLAISDAWENIDLEDFFTDLFCTYAMPWPYEGAGAIYIETLVSPHPYP